MRCCFQNFESANSASRFCIVIAQWHRERGEERRGEERKRELCFSGCVNVEEL
jgi:hypothetical protein